MTKSNLLATALITAAMLATPAMARTNHVISRVIVHPNQFEANFLGRNRFPGYAPIAPQHNRNPDPSNYGGDVSPEILEPSR